MIKTPTGEVPIEKLSTGDKVLTPFGISNVSYIHKVVADKVVSVRFSNGKSLTGKAKHGIFALHNGWTRLDSLLIGNEIESIKERPLWMLLNLLFTRVENIGFKALVDIIKTDATTHRRDFFIESSGLNIMGLFHKTCASITRMVIGLITALRIYVLCQLVIILRRTKSNIYRFQRTVSGTMNTWTGRELRQQSGTDQRRGWSGTQRTEEMHGRKEPCMMQSVFAADEYFRRGFPQEQNCVPYHVQINWRRRKTEMKELVVSAAKFFLCFVTGQRPPVVLNVQRKSLGGQDVYNLTLDKENAYYANDILVENCADSATMLVHLVRLRGDEVNARMTPAQEAEAAPQIGIVDKLEFKDYTDDGS
jgi:hypothetical protein